MEAVLDAAAGSTLASLVAAARAGDRDAFRALVEPDLAVALGARALHVAKCHAS